MSTPNGLGVIPQKECSKGGNLARQRTGRGAIRRRNLPLRCLGGLALRCLECLALRCLECLALRCLETSQTFQTPQTFQTSQTFPCLCFPVCGGRRTNRTLRLRIAAASPRSPRPPRDFLPNLPNLPNFPNLPNLCSFARDPSKRTRRACFMITSIFVW